MPIFSPRRLMEKPALFCTELDHSTLASVTRRRAQFEAGRRLLHHAAREVFGAATYRVEVVDERPVVTLEGAPAPAAASLSHSADVVICGLAASGLLGVDVERIRPRKQWEGLAEFALHPDESRRLEELPDADRWQGFYRVWTLKEALAKALGVGLALPFNRISFDAQNRIEAAPSGAEFANGVWNFYTPQLGSGYAAAAAWRAGSC
jgi:4'-phosphopantetheinyl transferase EntD